MRAFTVRERCANIDYVSVGKIRSVIVGGLHGEMVVFDPRKDCASLCYTVDVQIRRDPRIELTSGDIFLVILVHVSNPRNFFL